MNIKYNKYILNAHLCLLATENNLWVPYLWVSLWLRKLLPSSFVYYWILFVPSGIKPMVTTICICHLCQPCIWLGRICLMRLQISRLVEWPKDVDVQKNNFLLWLFWWYPEIIGVYKVGFFHHIKSVQWGCIAQAWARGHGV